MNDDFEPDDFEAEKTDDFEPDQPGGYEGFAQSALGFMRNTGPALLGGYEKYVSAPIRAGVGAALDKPLEFGGSTRAVYEQFGEDPSKAPTAGQLLEKAGINVPSLDIPTPFQKDLEGNRFEINTKELAGGLAGAAIDPMSYIPIGKAIPGKQMAGKALAEFAEERAAKQSLGKGVAKFREAAGATPRGVPDLEKATGKVRKLGRAMLDEGEVGYLSSTEGIGKRASEKFTQYKNEIEDLGKTIDRAFPEGVGSGKEIAQKIVDYASEIPETEGGKSLQNRLLAEAANFEKMPNMTFGQMQKFKNQFQYRPQDADAFVSNQDAVNSIKRIIGESMEAAADKAAISLKDTPQDAKKAALYRDLKKKYGHYKQVAKAATDRQLAEFSNNYVRPMDWLSGLAAGSGVAASGDYVAATAAALGTGALTSLARTRGGAFAARSADALSKVLLGNPQKFGKWQNKLISAASRSPNAFVVTHQLLMESDPEYRQTFLSEFKQ